MIAASLVALAALVPVLLAWRVGNRAIDTQRFAFDAEATVNLRAMRQTPANSNGAARLREAA